MLNPVSKKICIVVKSLGGGGAERSAGLLSIMLSDLGHEVHVVTVLNDIKYPYAGTLLNLGTIKDQNSKLSAGLKRFRTLFKYIRSNDFDYLIDNRTRVNRMKEFLVSKILYKPNKTIYCMRSFNLYNYMPTNAFMARMWYGNANKVVGVSEAISEKLQNKYHFNNVITIQNPIDISFEKSLSDTIIEGDYILFFGRLIDAVKNVSLLIEAYEKSNLHQENVKLVIMGDGKDKVDFEKKVAMKSCADSIQFLDFNPNPSNLITNAKYTVLTSHYEGFPRMILESLSLGTPIISVNCMSGPSEIIQNGKNGLLVDNYNVVALTEAMNTLYFDEELYQRCKENSKSSVVKFSQNNIAKQWQNILN
ncbi:glycosyltransferase [uncultured Winogradskyella sp.]|uniref:glycosyltransferase n=1 Tax=uncultured Winogradskyella sp. TaxID=395353 RepID=UPI00261D3E7E|nr:glycosyltransferase [uncultured Winogradskyella sp.]